MPLPSLPRRPAAPSLAAPSIAAPSLAARLATALALVAALALPAAAESIACPVDRLTSEVTTRLPQGWSSDPVSARLQETQVVTRPDGSRVLECRYGAAGTIRRSPPRGTVCTAVRGGFSCVPAGPAVRARGDAVLREGNGLDLDTGQVRARGADLIFQVAADANFFLAPLNGAQVAVGGGGNRGYAGCRDARYSGQPVALRATPTGSYVCVRTSDRRIAQIRIEGIYRARPDAVALSFTTWE